MLLDIAEIRVATSGRDRRGRESGGRETGLRLCGMVEDPPLRAHPARTPRRPRSASAATRSRAILPQRRPECRTGGEQRQPVTMGVPGHIGHCSSSCAARRSATGRARIAQGSRACPRRRRIAAPVPSRRSLSNRSRERAERRGIAGELQPERHRQCVRARVRAGTSGWRRAAPRPPVREPRLGMVRRRRSGGA